MNVVRSIFSRQRFAIAFIALLVAVDQLVKWLVERSLAFHAKIDVLPSLALFRTHNDGIAFSMLSGIGDKVLIVLTIAIIAFVTWLWARSTPSRWLGQFGFVLIISGAIGNLIDRAMHGYVIDYILFYMQSWSFAVFNLADAYISIGAAAIIVDELFGKWIYGADAAESV